MWILWEICPAHKQLDLEESLNYLEEKLLGQYPLTYLYDYVDFHYDDDDEPKYISKNYKILRQVKKGGVFVNCRKENDDMTESRQTD